MTLLIWFHTSQYRTFQAFYQHHVCRHLRDAFPGLVSYGRFVEFMPSALIPLGAYCVNVKPLHGDFVYRLYSVGGLCGGADPPAPPVCRPRPMGQKLDRVVLLRSYLRPARQYSRAKSFHRRTRTLERLMFCSLSTCYRYSVTRAAPRARPAGNSRRKFCSRPLQ